MAEKEPLPQDLDPRYGELMSKKLKELLSAKDAPVFHLVSRAGAEELLTREHPWPWYGQLMKGPQTIAYLLQIDFWLRHYNVELLF